MPPETIRARLEALAEPRYRDFAAKLIPGAPRLLGVRLPALRTMARELARTGQWRLTTPADATVEEVMLRGFLIGYAPRKIGWQERLDELAHFVPLISNWSICDSCCCTYTFVCPHREQVWAWLAPFLASAEEYPARFGIVMLLNHFKQDAAWAARVAAALPGVPATDYYAEMALAWCACELILLYPELSAPLLDTLRPSVHRLTLRKLRESRRTINVYSS